MAARGINANVGVQVRSADVHAGLAGLSCFLQQLAQCGDEVPFAEPGRCLGCLRASGCVVFHAVSFSEYVPATISLASDRARVRSGICTQPEQLRLSLGKTACGAKASQTNRRGLRLQAQSGFAAPSCARRRPRKTPAPVPDADSTPAFCMHGINKKGFPAETGKPFLFIRWWRRRESNPRPQALHRQFYILSTII